MQAAQSAVRSSQRDRGERGDWTDFAHTAPGTLAGRYMRRFWHPVYRSEDLPTGCAMPLKIMGEDYSLYRGEDGAAHALAFRCAHRGTQLSTGWVEGHNLRCFYHGWVYGPDGQCVEQPAEPEPFCGRIKIRSYPVREYLGVILVFLGEGEPIDLWNFPEFEGDGVLRVVGPQRWPCNYFNRVENSLDHVHGAFVHRRRVGGYGLGEVPQIFGYEAEYGIKAFGIRQGHVRMMHFHMPNINYRTPWAAPNAQAATEVDPEGGVGAAVVCRVPIDDESCAAFIINYLRPQDVAPDAARRRGEAMQANYGTAAEAAEAVLRGEIAVEDVRAAMSNVTNVEDYVAQVGQGAIADRTAEHLGRSDMLIALLRQVYSREMRNLAEGQPLKRWGRPADGYEQGRVLAPGEELELALLRR